MTITSKFDIGDKVWVPRNGRYYECTIDAVKWWDESSGFLYSVAIVAGDLMCYETYSEKDLTKLEDKESLLENLFVYSDN